MKNRLIYLCIAFVLTSAMWGQRSVSHSTTNPFNPDDPINPGSYALEVTVSPAEGGTIVGAGEYEQGTEVQIMATDNTCYLFVQWSDGLTTATRTIIMTAHDTTLTAYFEKIQYTVTLETDNPNQGDVEGVSPIPSSK